MTMMIRTILMLMMAVMRVYVCVREQSKEGFSNTLPAPVLGCVFGQREKDMMPFEAKGRNEFRPFARALLARRCQ
jgi:hypothetical protein